VASAEALLVEALGGDLEEDLEVGPEVAPVADLQEVEPHMGLGAARHSIGEAHMGMELGHLLRMLAHMGSKAYCTTEVRMGWTEGEGANLRVAPWEAG
jgi:hypothetical protein